MIVRTASSSQATKPEMKTAYRLLPHSPPPLDPTYDWSEAEATDGTTKWTIWAGVLHRNDVNCKILNCSDVGGELLRYMVADIAENIDKALMLGDRFGKLHWEAGEESSVEDMHAYMIMGNTDDILHDEDDDGEEHIWWNIVCVDAPPF